MEPGSKYEDLITRYLLKEATPEEEGFVLDWIKADEKNELYLEELGRMLQLIEIKQGINSIDVHEEWNQFQNQVFGKQQTVAPLEASAWEIINEQKRKQRAKIYRIIISTAAAAVIILLIGIGSGLFTKNSQKENPIPQQAQTPEIGNKIDPLMAVVQHETNTSGKIKKFITPDGSEITLFDSSEITYKEPVEGSKRVIYLVGKAEFKVAKNKTKPFTVFSGDISTTAIGTVFTVTARQNEKYIRVKLDEGKVVVKSTNANNQKWTKDFYMTPGEELMYDKSRQTATVQSLVDRKMNNKASDQEVDSPTIPNYDKGSWFMFNNQSLSEVFDALAAMYDARIVYSKDDIKNMYFIGTYEKSDSLERILNEIALLNKLQVSKLDNGFKIERKALKK